jgi:hypothetical protein
MATLEKVGSRVYVTGDSYAIKDRLKSAGCHWDGDRRQWWIGTAKAPAVESILNAKSEPADEPKGEDPDRITLIGKAIYKGRNYYVRWLGECKSGDRKARLVTLDGKIDFWADANEVQVIKRYEAREFGYGRYKRSEPMTLGSIQRFVERQKREESRPGYVKPEVCGECGRPGELVRDLEDGMLKHYRCCDIPPSGY